MTRWALLRFAVEVLGAREARRWLTRPSRLLEGDTPSEHARTPAGIQRVWEVVGRIAHGIPE